MVVQYLLTKDYDININNMIYESFLYTYILSNSDKVLYGDPYIIYYNPDVIAKKIDELVARIP